MTDWTPDPSRWDNGACHVPSDGPESHEQALYDLLHAHRDHPAFRAVLDVLEGRVAGVMKTLKACKPGDEEIMRLHLLQACYEDIIAALTFVAAKRGRDAEEKRRAEREKVESARADPLLAAGLTDEVASSDWLASPHF